MCTRLEVPKRVNERKPVSERGCPEAILVRETTVERSEGGLSTHRAKLRTVRTPSRVVAWHLSRPTTMAKSVKADYLAVYVPLPPLNGDSLERDWGPLMVEGERTSPPPFLS